MVDCGPGTVYKLMQTDVPFAAVNHLFFTHYHSDHNADYAPFLLTHFERRINEPDLIAYGPAGLKQMTHQIIGRNEGAFWSDVVARTQHPMSIAVYRGRGGQGARPEPKTAVIEFDDEFIATGNGWHCTALEVDHAQPYLDCYGLRFETDAGILAFSGDTNYSANAIQLGQDADLFVVNALEGIDVAAQMAEEAGAKRLLLAHYSHEFDEPPAKAEASKMIRGMYGGEIIWGHDLLEVVW